jgi:hypothetical protein
VGLALLVAIPVLMLVAAYGWAGVYGQDAHAYHAYATGELREALLAGRAPAPFPWPPGFPLLVAAASLVTGPVTAAGQAISLLAAMAIPVLTWALARELARLAGWRPWVAPLAGAVAAVSPHLWQSGAVVMSDTTGLAAMTAGAWATTRWAAGARLRWAVLGSAAIAFAIDTRQVYLAAALPVALATLVVGWRHGAAGGWRGRARTLGLPLLAGLLVLAPVIGPMGWAALQNEPAPFAVALGSHTWSLANVLRDVTTGPDGVQRWPLPMGLNAIGQPFQPYHLGPLFGVLAIVGGARVLRRVRDAMALAVLAGWPALVLLVLAGDVIQNTRFALTVLPPLAVLAAAGAEGIAGRLVGRSGVMGRRGIHVLGLVVVLALGVQLVGAARFTDAFIARFTADARAIAAVVARIPRDERVLAFGATLALRFAGREAIALDELSPAEATTLIADGRRTWVVMPAGGFDAQWDSTPVGTTFAALRDRPGLMSQGRHGSWELWAVVGNGAGARAGPAPAPGSSP